MNAYKTIFLLSVLLSTKMIMASPLHEEVRTLYKQAASEEKSCKKLITLLSAYTPQNDPLLSGYKACATMMMAKYTFNPMNKWANFSEGKKLLEDAIAADRQNIELRFLRFSVQTQAPSFLGYNDAIANDKSILLNAVHTLKDIRLKQLIVSFLKDSEYLTPIEKKCIKQ